MQMLMYWLYAATGIEVNTTLTWEENDQCLALPLPERLEEECNLYGHLRGQLPEALTSYVERKTLPILDEREESVRVTRRQDVIEDSSVVLEFMKGISDLGVVFRIDIDNPVLILGSMRSNARVFLGYGIQCDKIFELREQLSSLSGIKLAHLDPRLMANGAPIFLHLTVGMISPERGVTVCMPGGKTVLPLSEFTNEMVREIRPEGRIYSSNARLNKREVLQRKDIHRAVLEGYVEIFKSLWNGAEGAKEDVLKTKDAYGVTLQERIEQAQSERIKGATEIAEFVKANIVLVAS